MFVDNLLISCIKSRKLAKKERQGKKNEIFLPLPLAFIPENSIIGTTPETSGPQDPESKGTEAREAAGQFEGIGDVLSDGPKRDSWKSIRT